MLLEELRIYTLSMALAEEIWTIATGWPYFSKDTPGKQIVRSADSISANISEGFGRYHYKEAKNFGYFARGSLYETKTFIKKAHSRKLISEKELNALINECNFLGASLNKYIKSIGNNKTSHPPVDE